MAEAICLCMAARGMSIPMSTMVSSLRSMSLGLSEWPVLRLPLCPVDIACIMSIVSAPLTSPTMMRSGRILRAVRISYRMVISPAPSMFGFLASILTRLGTPWI